MKKQTKIFLITKSGLGNQLFQYAIARELNLLIPNSKLIIDSSSYKQYKLRAFELDRLNIPSSVSFSANALSFFKKIFFLLMKNFHRVEYKLTRTNKKDGLKHCSHFLFRMRESFGYIIDLDSCYHPLNIKKLAKKRNIYIYGYFQSPVYFENNREQIVRECLPNVDKTSDAYYLGEKMRKDNSCAVSFRCSELKKLGLFIDDLEPGYIGRMQNELKNETNITKYLFTEDIASAKLYLDDFQSYKICSKFSPIEQLYLMSKCQTFFVMNSSFSLWGYYLSDRSNKKMYCPSIWYKDVKTIDCPFYSKEFKLI